jgi:hypothetical protein
VYAKQAEAVVWERPTKVLTVPRDGSSANAAAYAQFAAADGFAWAALARKAGIDPNALGSLGIGGFSAFHGAGNAMLANAEDRARVCYAHLADACFSGASGSAPSPPKSGYLAFAREAVAGDKLLVATTNGPWGKDIHYCWDYGDSRGNVCYDLTSGAKCIQAVWEEAVGNSAVKTPDVPPGAPPPTNAYQCGNFLWFHYEDGAGTGDPHGVHASMATAYIQYFGAPWMAQRSFPGVSRGSGSSTAAKIAYVLGGAAAVAGGWWAWDRWLR